MDRKEPKPPGEESPDDMDLFFKDITKVLDVEIDMDDNPITKFKCVDKVGDVDDEDYASDATEPFGPVYDRKKIIKTERSRSNSPVTNSTQHARIRPPTPESRDIKPDRRKLDENIRRRETSYSKRSRSRSRDRSSRGHSHRSRDRSLNSKDRRVNSRDREDRDRNSYRRRSRSTSPIRTSQQRSLESRRPPRSRYHVRSRSSSSGSDAGKRSRDRREHKISPKRRRADSRDLEEPKEIFRCARCLVMDARTYRSIGCQKSVGQSDFAVQTCEQLVEKHAQPTVTTGQLHVINQLIEKLDTDITPVQLAHFILAEFGKRNQNDWQQTMTNNERFLHPGRSEFEAEHDIDFDAVNRSITRKNERSSYGRQTEASPPPSTSSASRFTTISGNEEYQSRFNRRFY